MKLFLTSTAANVMNKIVPGLPKKPEDTSVLFIPTAGNVYEKTPWIDDDLNKLKVLGFRLKVLDIEHKTEQEIRDAIHDIDLVFVAGGNTFYLLEQMRKSGFDKLLCENIDNIVYIGSSAGSVICGPDLKPVEIFDDRAKSNLKDTRGLNFIDCVVLPHFGKEKYGPYHKKVIKEYGDQFKIIPITDGQYIEVNNNGYELF